LAEVLTSQAGRPARTATARVGRPAGRCLAFGRDNHDGSPEKGFYQCRVKGEDLTYEFVEVK